MNSGMSAEVQNWSTYGPTKEPLSSIIKNKRHNWNKRRDIVKFKHDIWTVISGILASFLACFYSYHNFQGTSSIGI